MCTSLRYRDTSGKIYFGRTLELTMDLPYVMAWLPSGYRTVSTMDGAEPFEFCARFGIFAVTMPARRPTAASPLATSDLKVIEGVNKQGLTFSLLSYPAAAGGHHPVAMTTKILAASDLGTWVLGQFSTVAEVKSALAEQPVMVQPLAILGGVESPFHYVMHDRSGAALVVEFDGGTMSVYDNPVGVMTNGPSFPWHLTNLNNYTFLTNVDASVASFGGHKVIQPDSGIATAGLPASNTSVGRFVRAAYYAEFTEKAAAPDAAVLALAHILNTFDRARGVTIDYPQPGGGHLEVAGLEPEERAPYATEFTSWTSLTDLDRTLFFIRDYESLNFTKFDLGALAAVDTPRTMLLKGLDDGTRDATETLKGSNVVPE
ncbi:penicillin V acylase-like amidase (Ntn superfamily) [Rhodoligotrophos appendicifer]|uniref:linear amide C-N hydrolase n=1 Tax=Rhodoligotrophos appendicifer TaxID=987056 RepID=UPI001184AA89|nr:linear amide C-N hydrolase [Rhodoligotrophos appendicifer]